MSSDNCTPVPSLFEFARKRTDYRRLRQDYREAVLLDVENSGWLLIWLQRHTAQTILFQREQNIREACQGTEYMERRPRVAYSSILLAITRIMTARFLGRLCFTTRKNQTSTIANYMVEKSRNMVQLSGCKTGFKTRWNVLTSRESWRAIDVCDRHCEHAIK